MERTSYTAPAINVIENEKEYELELAAPGLSKEDFKIQLDGEGNLERLFLKVLAGEGEEVRG